ncbi:hypothetical protein TEQG_08194 [Trichophyton equinum CBS 127.97]|uniref:Uncharacterized protein n=1 Tax=Trichophyton equinum (strain ATCC MYA-4606 / CBS 127.97) TaxID=559882 RepID=F2Q526_TRIEC|nr:hypothetical protein TEQG_08194 [Trichophyton equinum CBS 127.97]
MVLGERFRLPSQRCGTTLSTKELRPPDALGHGPQLRGNEQPAHSKAEIKFEITACPTTVLVERWGLPRTLHSIEPIAGHSGLVLGPKLIYALQLNLSVNRSILLTLEGVPNIAISHNGG